MDSAPVVEGCDDRSRHWHTVLRGGEDAHDPLRAKVRGRQPEEENCVKDPHTAVSRVGVPERIAHAASLRIGQARSG
jgi:hypothetical protein